MSNARLDLPEPDSPVNTIIASRGRSRLTSLRLCSRAPRTMRRSFTRCLLLGLVLAVGASVPSRSDRRSDKWRHATNPRHQHPRRAGGLLDFVRPRHSFVLITARRDGSPQASPVTGGVGRRALVISSYPERAKSTTCAAPRRPVLVLSDEFNGAWVQVDGTAEVLDMPSRRPRTAWSSTSGASAASTPTGTSTGGDARPGQVADPVTPIRWGPVATGGFPARLPT